MKSKIIIGVVIIVIVVLGISAWSANCPTESLWSITKGCYPDPAGFEFIDSPDVINGNLVTNINSQVVEEDFIPTGSPALFYRDSLGTVQNRLRTYDVNWESSSSVMVRELPETDQLDAYHSYTSSSYSKQSKYPVTYNERLFLLTDWGSEWTSDNNRWNLVEYDPSTLERSGADISFQSDNFTVAGDNLYLTTPVIKDKVGGWVKSYGSLQVVSLDESTDTNATDVFNFTSYNDRGGLYGVGDELLLVTFNIDNEPSLMNISHFDRYTNSINIIYDNLIVDDFSMNNIYPANDGLYIMIKEGNSVFINLYPIVGEPESILELELEPTDENIYLAQSQNSILIYTSSNENGSVKIRNAIVYNLLTKEASEYEVGPFSIPVSFSRIGVPFLIIN